MGAWYLQALVVEMLNPLFINHGVLIISLFMAVKARMIIFWGI